MMYSIYFSDKFAFSASSSNEIQHEIQEKLNLAKSDYYLLQNGKRLNNSPISDKYAIHIIPRLIGGKGGFGSMLRAIGAQIEKTTNREACRDLSGRRLRDINEEKRLKTWIEQQVEREKEATDRKQKKLERLVHLPKHVFKDENYEKDRSALPEMVEDALEQGLKASSSMGSKRAHDEDVKKQKKKKPKLWLASDDELSSSSEADSETEANEQKNESSCSSSTSDKKEENSCSSSSSEIKEEKSNPSNEIVDVKQDDEIQNTSDTKIEIKST